MVDISCEQIANYLDADYTGSNVVFNSISTDSRNIIPGALFIAIVGENFDGHDFIDAAIANGAAGILVSKPVAQAVTVITVKNTTWAFGQIAAMYRAKFKIPMVGITGSCGKTTVKELLTNILRQCGNTLSPPGSYNNEIGLPQTLLQLNNEHKYAVLEMGARNPGDIKYLMELVNPSVSVINNVAPVHLETFGDIDSIAKVKGEIYQYLQPHGTAVVNVDEPYAPFWFSLLKTQNIITFGMECAADITCAYYVEEHHRIRFELVTDLGSEEVCMQMLGAHNIKNALAAAACARALDIPLEEIKAGLESTKATTRRLELKNGQSGCKIIDDSYNANPVAMQLAIDTLIRQGGKKIMVMSDMLELGSLASQSHSNIGEYAKVAGVDFLLACGELSKFAVEQFGENGSFYHDKSELINDLRAMLDEKTVVLVKASNGMRMNEVVEAIVKTDV